MGIYTINTNSDSGSYMVTKSSELWSYTVNKQNHLMWLDGNVVNTLQKCKLERPIKIAGLEQFGS